MGNCIFCGKELVYSQHNDNTHFYECSSCGRFLLSEEILLNPSLSIKNMKSEFASYLYYNKVEDRCFFVGTNEGHSNYLRGNPESTSILLTKEMVENWYPKTFSEKIDLILLKLGEKSLYDGAPIFILDEMLFIKRTKPMFESEDESLKSQRKYIMDFLLHNEYITESKDPILHTLTPKALERIYELQKTNSTNKDVFVSMAFNDGTKDTREAIRSGIDKAGFSSKFIDEIIHNHQIMPEMFRLIRECRFLILEISDPNYGAYYEAGYALGLGKEVIICCKEEIFNKEYTTDEEKKYAKYLKPHFDIAQKQILVWKDYEDLTKKLSEWIKALF